MEISAIAATVTTPVVPASRVRSPRATASPSEDIRNTVCPPDPASRNSTAARAVTTAKEMAAFQLTTTVLSSAALTGAVGLTAGALTAPPFRSERVRG